MAVHIFSSEHTIYPPVAGCDAEVFTVGVRVKNGIWKYEIGRWDYGMRIGRKDKGDRNITTNSYMNINADINAHKYIVISICKFKIFMGGYKHKQ